MSLKKYGESLWFFVYVAGIAWLYFMEPNIGFGVLLVSLAVINLIKYEGTSSGDV